MQFSENIKFSKQNLIQIVSKGNYSFHLDNEGRLSQNHFKKIMKPVLFDQKISIKTISASYQFVHFLASNGSIYSSGQNAKG
jgi:hypothetical protein